MDITIFNYYSGERCLLQSNPQIQKIKYATHPAKSYEEKLTERPFSVAELLRMPRAHLITFFSNLSTTHSKKLRRFILRAYKNQQLSESRMKNFDSAWNQANDVWAEVA